MEKVQKRALRTEYNDYDSSYYDLRVKSKRPLMYIQRLRSILSEMHKIYHGLGPEYMKDLVKNSDCMYITRNTKRVELPVCRTVRYGYNSFLTLLALLATVKPLHRIIATSMETCRRLHRKMRLHWKSHSGLQSTSLLGYFTGKKPLHWKHEGSNPLLQENATSFEIAFKLTTVSKKN